MKFELSLLMLWLTDNAPYWQHGSCNVTSSEKNLSIIAKAALYTSKFWWVCKASILDIPEQGTEQTLACLRKQQILSTDFELL